MRVCSGPIQSATRLTVAWSNVSSPNRGRNCLGRFARLAGQNRVPLPPAMITACNISRARSLLGVRRREKCRLCHARAGLNFGPRFVRIESKQRTDLDGRLVVDDSAGVAQPTAMQPEQSL